MTAYLKPKTLQIKLSLFWLAFAVQWALPLNANAAMFYGSICGFHGGYQTSVIDDSQSVSYNTSCPDCTSSAHPVLALGFYKPFNILLIQDENPDIRVVSRVDSSRVITENPSRAPPKIKFNIEFNQS